MYLITRECQLFQSRLRNFHRLRLSTPERLWPLLPTVICPGRTIPHKTSPVGIDIFGRESIAFWFFTSIDALGKAFSSVGYSSAQGQPLCFCTVCLLQLVNADLQAYSRIYKRYLYLVLDCHKERAYFIFPELS